VFWVFSLGYVALCVCLTRFSSIQFGTIPAVTTQIELYLSCSVVH
jgi:hypothetical protein